MWNAFLDYLFPRRSLQGKEGGWVTPEERRRLVSHPEILETSVLRHLGLQSLDRICAGTNYRECPLLREAVASLKYRRVRGIAEELGAVLVGASTLLFTKDVPVLCPVPLHWTRKFSRGFNQSEMLASFVAKERGWKMENLLRRVRPTGSQVGRKRKARLEALKGSFRVLSGVHVPSSVILVDDVSTTGATLEECAKVLKSAGVLMVQGLVLAHG